MRGQCRHAHRDERPFSGRHRTDRGEKLIGAGAIHDPQHRRAAGRQLERSLAPILFLDSALDEAPPDEAIDEPARRRRRAVDGLGKIADRHRPGVGEDIEGGELREAKAHLAQLGREADHELPPQRAAHRDAFRDLTDIRDPRPRRKNGRRQIGLEATRDRPRRRRWPEPATAGLGVHRHRRETCRVSWGRRMPATRVLRAMSHTPARVSDGFQGYADHDDFPAYVFPGQGSQSVGMGQALAAASPAAAAVFSEADRALGEPIAKLAFEGPADELDRTENAQPALLATSIAYLAALRERWASLGIGRPRRPWSPGTRWASTARWSPPR